jgi:hypothetical protein
MASLNLQVDFDPEPSQEQTGTGGASGIVWPRAAGASKQISPKPKAGNFKGTWLSYPEGIAAMGEP